MIELSPRQLDELAERYALYRHNDGYMTTRQVCEWLQLRRDYLYDLVAAHGIPYVKLGRLLRFKRSELEAWIAGQHQ